MLHSLLQDTPACVMKVIMYCVIELLLLMNSLHFTNVLYLYECNVKRGHKDI